MNRFKEDLERRKEDRRRKKSSTWIGLLIKILLLVLVIYIMHYLRTPKAGKVTDVFLPADSSAHFEEGEK